MSKDIYQYEFEIEEGAGVTPPGSSKLPSSKVVAQAVAALVFLLLASVLDLPVGDLPEFAEQAPAVLLAAAIGYAKREFRPGNLYAKV